MTSKPNEKQLEMEIEKIYKDLTKEQPPRKKPTRDQVQMQENLLILIIS